MILSPFRYAGAKNRLLPVLKEYLDPLLVNSDRYCEPFIGGGSVGLSVAKQYPKIILHFNDKDQWISSFWRVVSGDYSKLQDLLSMVEQPATIQHFYKLSQTTPSTEIEEAYHAIFFNRTCFSGIVKRDKNNKVISNPIGGKNQTSKYTVDCRYNLKKLKEKIIECHQLLVSRTVVENLDVNDYLAKIDSDIPTYLDPPYWKQGWQLYHEYMQENEHQILCNSLQKRTNWVLSYDDAVEIRKLYHNNQIIDLAARYSINGKKDNWEKKNELIILG